MGAIIVGVSTFLAITVAQGDMPIIGVIISLIGGICAGHIMGSDSR